MAERFQVLVLNQISANGLKRLPVERYSVGKDVAAPDALLLRSADLHGRAIASASLLIARAGARTNKIPVPGAAGRSARSTGSPVCRPIPVHCTRAAIVCSTPLSTTPPRNSPRGAL